MNDRISLIALSLVACAANPGSPTDIVDDDAEGDRCTVTVAASGRDLTATARCVCGRTEVTTAKMVVTSLRCPWCPPETPSEPKPTLRLVVSCTCPEAGLDPACTHHGSSAGGAGAEMA